MATPSGNILLLKNVPIRADYEHSIDFKDASEQYSFWQGYVKYSLDNYSYVRKEREYIVAGLPLQSLDDINYLIFRSADDERLYYAFVTNKVYVNQETTYIYFIIDVLQTYMFDYKFGASYIAQAHEDRWNAEHKPIYSKTDEGLAYGEEYAVESAHALRQSERLRWVMVTLRGYPSDLVSEGSVIENSNLTPVASPFAILLLPLPIGHNSSFNNVHITGINSSVGIGTYSDFCEVMLKSAIGNYISTITLLAYNPFIQSESYGNLSTTISFNSAAVIQTVTFNGGARPFLILMDYVISGDTSEDNVLTGTLAEANWDLGLESSLPTEEQWSEIKAKPYTTKRDKRFESKLLCAPYRYNLLTDWRTAPVVFKNEYMPTDKISVKYSMALSHNAPYRYWVKDYKKDPEGRYTSLSQPMSLEFPVLSDQYYTYLLENKNTIQTNLENSLINGAVSVGMGAASGFAMGGVWGAAAGAVAGVVNAATSTVTMVRSENAKQADIKKLPDNLISNTDSAFNIIDKNTEVQWYRMRLCCENEEILAEIFNMQGYKVNRVAVPNLRSRVRFNYLRTVGANILGSFNQADVLKIRDIFDKGVTIWHYTPENFKPLDYTFENIEVNLL